MCFIQIPSKSPSKHFILSFALKAFSFVLNVTCFLLSFWCFSIFHFNMNVMWFRAELLSITMISDKTPNLEWQRLSLENKYWWRKLYKNINSWSRVHFPRAPFPFFAPIFLSTCFLASLGWLSASWLHHIDKWSKLFTRKLRGTLLCFHQLTLNLLLDEWQLQRNDGRQPESTKSNKQLTIQDQCT